MNNTALYALTVIIWGLTWYAIALQVGVVSPVLSVGYRNIIAAVVLGIFVLWKRGTNAFNFSAKQHGLLLILGLTLFCLNYILIYFSSINLTSGLVAVLFACITLMNILNQKFFFKIQINPKVLIGSLIGLIGVIFVFLPEIKKTDNTMIYSIALCLTGAYLASIGNMLSMKIAKENISIMASNTIGMAYGGITAVLIGIMLGAPLVIETTPQYILSLLFLAIFGSAIAFGSYLSLVRNIGADKAAYAAVLFPIVALAVSTFLEGYTWSISAIFGLTLTILGNVIAMSNKNKIKNTETRIQEKAN